MRKQTKLVAALSATALLAIGASAVTFAAGWNNSTGNWQYLDNEGTPVSDAWRKSGDYWFYLGSDGNMATNEVVQTNNDFYYVNQDGAMVTNQWVAFDVDSENGDADHRWMYFGADGKAYRDGNEKLTVSDIKNINGKKYLFDQEGYMLYGWLGAESNLVAGDDAYVNAKYYYGGFDDGSAQHGWVQIPVIGDDGDEVNAWFYFNDNGQIVKNTKKNINGSTYYFGADGRMIEDWSKLKKTGSPSVMEAAKASSNQVVYVNGDGAARKNQWVWAVPSEALDSKDFEDEKYSWWWADSTGKVVKNTAKRIKNKVYAFDGLGRMLSGLVDYDSNRTDEKYKAIGADELADYLGATTHDVYYFSGDGAKDGSRKNGLQTVSFDDGDFAFYFNNNGKAASNYVSKIKKYTVKGLVLAADNDTSNYGYVTVQAGDYKKLATGTVDVGYVTSDMGNTIAGSHKVLVNTTGTVQKSKFNLKDVNDMYYVTDKNGAIVYADSKKLYTSKADGRTAVNVTRDGKTTKYWVEN